MVQGQKRSEIKYGMNVGVVLKEDQASGYITYGVVQKILTNSPTHPHGIKVRLMSGEVGRVKEIVK
ncbi:MAG: YwbE family protein [Sulfurovum sp.]|nr:YwbE family protein [Sulfurovum sp.]